LGSGLAACMGRRRTHAQIEVTCQSAIRVGVHEMVYEPCPAKFSLFFAQVELVLLVGIALESEISPIFPVFA